MTTRPSTEETKCEWCGADFDPAQVPPDRPHPTAPQPVTTTGPEPVTHCEWCGAEYPVPGAAT
ncbi:MAG: hypothetical protein U0Y82_02760 [Thermoleophilia bacterium]